MKAFKMPQLTPEWWEVRRGVPTSSDFDRIITPSKGDLSASADKYICALIGDIVMQLPDYFTSKGGPVRSTAMQNGRDTEPEARRWYSLETGINVAELGFVMDDDFHFGCSPDFVVGLQIADKPGGIFNGHEWFEATADAIGELKCPQLETQAGYLLKGKVLPADYKPQVHGHMVVCKTKRGEFVSYASGLDALHVSPEWDEYTDKVKAALDGFWVKFEDAKRRLLS